MLSNIGRLSMMLTGYTGIFYGAYLIHTGFAVLLFGMGIILAIPRE
jgi:hypothetical protein